MIKKSIWILFTFLLISNLFAEEPKYAKSRVIVKYKSGILEAQSTNNNLFNKYNISEKKKLFQDTRNIQSSSPESDLSKIYILTFQDDYDAKEVAEDFAKESNVEYAEPDYFNKLCTTSANDTHFSSQWGLTKIEAPEAWDRTTGSTDVVIAVIDTGVLYTHEDLADNMWTNKNEVLDGIDNDGNGYVDDIKGWNFSGGVYFGGPIDDYDDRVPDNNPIDNDIYSWNASIGEYDQKGGHGTHVAGIIGAKGNNSKGVSGVCWNVRIMPLKVFPHSYNSIIASAIRYAADNGARVINMSLGNYDYSSLINNAVHYAREKGVIIVAAGGNDNLSTIMYPAGNEGVIAVASTDENDNKSSFSNYGDWIDISAPGSNIYSTYKTSNNSYAYKNGTSMATPIVVGIIGLLLADNPNFSESHILTILKNTADDIVDSGMGAGRVNARRSVFFFTLGEQPEDLLNNVHYTIHGNVKDKDTDLEDVDVLLYDGTSTTTVQTDTYGDYTFGYQLAGVDYIVSVSTTTYEFSQKEVKNLSTNVVVNFDEVKKYNKNFNTNNQELKQLKTEFGNVDLTISSNTFSGNNANLSFQVRDTIISNSQIIKPTDICLELYVTDSQNQRLQPTKPIEIKVEYTTTSIQGMDENKLMFMRYVADSGEWIAVSSVVDADNNTITGYLDHLSVFSVVENTTGTAPLDIKKIFAYPNPYNPNNGGKLKVKELNSESKVRVFNILGQLVSNELRPEANQNYVEWDGRNRSGNIVASGIYVLYINDSRACKKIKIAVEK